MILECVCLRTAVIERIQQWALVLLLLLVVVSDAIEWAMGRERERERERVKVVCKRASSYLLVRGPDVP